MADLPMTEPYRVPINQAPGAVAPRVGIPESTRGNLRATQMPEIQRVGLKAASQYEGTVSQVLDRLSQTLFGINKKFSEEAGYQYVADNPLTPDQLVAAAKGDVTKVVATGPSINIEQNVIRKARAFEIAGHAEIEAKKVVIDMLPDIESGKVGTKDVQTRLATITDGYSRSISQIDPEASLKFRASLSTLGNTVLEKAANAELKRRQAENNIKLAIGFQNVERELEEIYGRTTWGVDAQGTQLTPNQVADALRDGFVTQAAMIGGQQAALEYVQKWPKAVQDAKVNALTKYITTNQAMMADPLSTYNALRMGQAGELTMTYQSLDQDGKAKVMANLMTVVSNQASIADKQRKEREIKDKDLTLDLYEQWLQTKDPGEKRNLRNRMLQLNTLTLDQTKGLFENEDSNLNVVFKLEDDIDNGLITNSSDLLSRGERAGLSGKQLVDLRRRMSTRVGQEVKAGMRRLAGIPEGLVQIDPKGEQATKYFKIRDRMETLRNEAAASGKPFDEVKALRTIEQEFIDRRNSDAAKAAKGRLEIYEKKYGAPITSQSLPTLKQQIENKKTPITMREFQQIEREVRTAEGLD
jgi:hypothetical protein